MVTDVWGPCLSYIVLWCCGGHGGGDSVEVVVAALSGGSCEVWMGDHGSLDSNLVSKRFGNGSDIRGWLVLFRCVGGTTRKVPCPYGHFPKRGSFYQRTYEKPSLKPFYLFYYFYYIII